MSDFGICKSNINWFKKKNSVAGTLDYCAPEVLSKLNYDNSVDYWSLGVTIYKMMASKNPFHLHLKVHDIDKEKVRSEIKRHIISSSIFYPANRHLNDMCSLIRRLLRRYPQARLGYGPNGAEDVKRHEFFQKISWDSLIKTKIKPPIIPKSFVDKIYIQKNCNYDDFCYEDGIESENRSEENSQTSSYSGSEFNKFNVILSNWNNH